MFSIIIRTYNNLEYFKICINSIYKNSLYDHEIIIHINDGSDGTKKYVDENKLKYTYTKNNVGLCSGINLAANLSTTKYILYSHDDMYFCPQWDEILLKEINKIDHDNFYFSGTMIQKSNGHIDLDCGNSPENFDVFINLLNLFIRPPSCSIKIGYFLSLKIFLISSVNFFV